MFARFCGVALMAPLVSACAVSAPRAPDITLPATFEARPQSHGLQASDIEPWWRLYRDPQLDALVAEALQGGFDARLARARLEEAQAVRGAAHYQIYWPAGAMEASASHGSGDSDGSGNVDAYAASFSSSWELDLFGRRAASRRIADAELHTAEFTAAATRWALVAQVADNLFAARGLAVQLVEARETLRIQSELAASAKVRVDHGLAPASDAAQTRASVAAARAQVEELAAQLDAGQRALLALVGRGRAPSSDLPITAQIDAPPPPPPSVPGDMLLRRPDVRAAQSRLSAAAGRQELAHLDFLPTVTLSPSYGVSRLTGSGASGIWSLGASAKVPVLDVSRLRKALLARQAVSEQAVLSFERSVQAAYVDVETAMNYLDSDSRRVALLRAAVHDGALGYEAKSEGYRRGFNDLQAALAAESAWRQARSDLATGQVTALQRSVQVFKALGGGWSAPSQGAQRLADPAQSTPAA